MSNTAPDYSTSIGARADHATGLIERASSYPVIVKAISGFKTRNGAKYLAAYIGRLRPMDGPPRKDGSRKDGPGKVDQDREAAYRDAAPVVLDQDGAIIPRDHVIEQITGWDLADANENLSPLARSMPDGGRSLPVEKRFHNVLVRHFIFSAPLRGRDEGAVPEAELAMLETAVGRTISRVFNELGHRSFRATHSEHGGHPHIHVAVRCQSDHPPYRRLRLDRSGVMLDRLRHVLAEECRIAGLREMDSTRWADRRKEISRIIDGLEPVPKELKSRPRSAPPRRLRHRQTRETRTLRERLQEKVPGWSATDLRAYDIRRATEEIRRLEGKPWKGEAWRAGAEGGEEGSGADANRGGRETAGRRKPLLSRALEFYGLGSSGPGGESNGSEDPERRRELAAEEALSGLGYFQPGDVPGAARRLGRLVREQGRETALRVLTEFPMRYAPARRPRNRRGLRYERALQKAADAIAAFDDGQPSKDQVPEAQQPADSLADEKGRAAGTGEEAQESVPGLALFRRLSDLGVFLDNEGRDRSLDALMSYSRMRREDAGFANWCLKNQPGLFAPVTELAGFLPDDRVARRLIEELPEDFDPMRLKPAGADAGDYGREGEMGKGGELPPQMINALKFRENRQLRRLFSRRWLTLARLLDRTMPEEYQRRVQAMELADMAARAISGEPVGAETELPPRIPREADQSREFSPDQAADREKARPVAPRPTPSAPGPAPDRGGGRAGGGRGSGSRGRGDVER